MRAVLALPLLLLPACGPMDLGQAERACLPDAQMAQHPRGSVGFGIGSGGQTGASFEIGISSNYILGRDPDQVFASCVQARAGQPPSRPFHSFPESRM